jgi:hypothetical protein
MSNPHRAEHSLEIGGRRYMLRLTLQALAEIESALNVNGLDALGNKLSGGATGSRDLVCILGAMMRGGGMTISDSDLAGMIEARDLPRVLGAVGAVFAASFTEEKSSQPDPF